jgi:multimeric flavodoxin WrbA
MIIWLVLLSLKEQGGKNLKKEPIFESEGINYEIINLHDHRIDYCKGCETCITKDYCPIEDDVSKINEKLNQTDSIIFSTPYTWKIYQRY